MHVRLLGTAAGGGFPQWNCNCANCRGVRAGSVAARPRTQCSVAVSADGARWFLLGTSPDVRAQVESFPPLLPRAGSRGSGIEGVLLCNGDLDHTLGLWTLREGGPLFVHATVAVREGLNERAALGAVLARYCGVTWCEPPDELAPLCYRDGGRSGLSYAAVPVSGTLPRYCGGGGAPAGGCVGYLLVDDRTGGRLLFLPSVAALDGALLERLGQCDALLLDGTFWSEDEMRVAGAGSLGASEMGHLPVGGPGGSLARVAALAVPRKVYVHVNNTNPMLIDDSPERRAVRAAGAEVGWDGQEFRL